MYPPTGNNNLWVAEIRKRGCGRRDVRIARTAPALGVPLRDRACPSLVYSRPVGHLRFGVRVINAACFMSTEHSEQHRGLECYPVTGIGVTFSRIAIRANSLYPVGIAGLWKASFLTAGYTCAAIVSAQPILHSRPWHSR